MTLLPEVRRQLHQAAQRRASRSWTRRLPSPLRGGRRSRRGTLIILIGLLGTGAVAYGASRIIQGNAVRYANAAQEALVKRDPACGGVAIQGHLSHGTPSPALLSMLGVLRRPATPADALPSGLGRRPLPTAPLTPKQAHRLQHPRTLKDRLADFGGNVYVRYVRRARVAFGQAYYVIPSGNWQTETPPPARCTAELQADLPRMPAGLRATALKIVARSLINERRIDQPHETVCLQAIALTGRFAGLGTGTCGDTPSQINAGQELAMSIPPHGRATLSGLVPDDVATVTVYFSNSRAGGSLTASTTRPVGNVLVARAPHGIRDATPRKIVWRSATGAVLKTI